MSSDTATSVTRHPTVSDAPAALTCSASSLSKTPRSMTTASVEGVVYSMLPPEGPKKVAVLSGLSTDARGRSNSANVSSARTPVQ